MFDAGRRPMVRLFYLALTAIVSVNLGLRCGGAALSAETTTVSDTVYLADGTTAQGSLIITWPAFVTASGTAVAAGSTNVGLGANGALSVALVPNEGATPAGVYYSVIFQLGPGQVRTEFWTVPTQSPANLAKVRTTPGAGLAGQPVSMQYVNSALAAKADDSAVVHVSGTETIAGTKIFSSSPNVPQPTSAGDIATKGYVDETVTAVGAGSYLSTAGGTMTGPITLSGNPVSGMQATSKQYVDLGLSGKADLISGRVPATELGTGTANSSTCLLGNGTWGACASGGGTGYVNSSGTPASNQMAVWADASHIQGQAKAALDVRDYGVDCTGATDSSSALNTLFTGISNRVVDFPQTCQIRADAMPLVEGHPNRTDFGGVLTLVDVPSQRSPHGAHGHRVVLTRAVAERALPSLIGMALDYAPSFDRHDMRCKVGVITKAEVVGRSLEIGGYLYAKDFPDVVREIGKAGKERVHKLGKTADFKAQRFPVNGVGEGASLRASLGEAVAGIRELTAGIRHEHPAENNRIVLRAEAADAGMGEGLGMSYEVTDVDVVDRRARFWILTQATFTGAAILRRSKAAYQDTWIELS